MLIYRAARCTTNEKEKTAAVAAAKKAPDIAEGCRRDEKSAGLLHPHFSRPPFFHCPHVFLACQEFHFVCSAAIRHVFTDC